MPRVDLSLGDREFSPSAWCLRPRLVADHAPGSSSPVRSGATPRDPDRFEQARLLPGFLRLLAVVIVVPGHFTACSAVRKYGPSRETSAHVR